ncbi:RDD family protein, partial [Paraburkholderia sp. SIMBA_049]
FGVTVTDWIYDNRGLCFLTTGFATLPLCFLVDTVVYQCLGNTPGKTLLGISVRTLTGERLSPRQYLQRNLGLWGPAYAFGIPLVSLIA